MLASLRSFRTPSTSSPKCSSSKSEKRTENERTAERAAFLKTEAGRLWRNEYAKNRARRKVAHLLKTKNCEYCGNLFQQESRRQTNFCSPRCCKKHHNRDYEPVNTSKPQEIVRLAAVRRRGARSRQTTPPEDTRNRISDSTRLSFFRSSSSFSRRRSSSVGLPPLAFRSSASRISMSCSTFIPGLFLPLPSFRISDSNRPSRAVSRQASQRLTSPGLFLE